MTEPTLVEVFRAKNLAEAALVQQQLADAGIHAIIENENLQGVLGEVPAWNAAPRLMVEGKDALLARAMLAVLEIPMRSAARERRSDGAACLVCGAPMPDEVEQCPKCGWSYKEDQPEASLN